MSEASIHAAGIEHAVRIEFVLQPPMNIHRHLRQRMEYGNAGIAAAEQGRMSAARFGCGKAAGDETDSGAFHISFNARHLTGEADAWIIFQFKIGPQHFR